MFRDETAVGNDRVGLALPGLSVALKGEPSLRARKGSAGFAETSVVVPIWISPENPRLIELMVTLLNGNTPVIIGVGWAHPNSLKTDNLVGDQAPADMRGHSVVLVGYRNPEGRAGHTTFTFRNSYGDSWGFAGFGLMDESYLRRYFLSALHLRLQ